MFVEKDKALVKEHAVMGKAPCSPVGVVANGSPLTCAFHQSLSHQTKSSKS